MVVIIECRVTINGKVTIVLCNGAMEIYLCHFLVLTNDTISTVTFEQKCSFTP